MNNNLIGIGLALAIVAAIVAALMGTRTQPQIVDGVSSQAWFENIKPIEF